MVSLNAGVLLGALFSRKGIVRVHWAVETSHPGTGGDASLSGDFMRLIVVLSGRRDVRIACENGSFGLRLSAGHCLVMGPHSWLITERGHSFVSLGAVLEARNPRLVLARQEKAGVRGKDGPRAAPVEILPGLCDDTTMALGAALLAARSPASGDLYVRRLAEALWLRIARYRVPVRAADRGKAGVTYGAAEHYVRDNISRAIDRRDVARFLRISPSHVTRLFLRFAGETFGGFLLRIRLEGARKLLADPRLSVSEVAYLSGFTSPNYFVRAYHRRYAVTPGRDRGGSALLPSHAESVTGAPTKTRRR